MAVEAGTVRVGVVGTAFGTRVHVPGFLASGRYRVTAICSAQQARAEAAAAAFDISVATDDYRCLVERDDVDLVAVATPPALHAPVVLAALEAGKHVLCEKPFATSVDEARAMVHEAERHSVANAVVHEMRYLPARRHLRDLVRAGYLGDLRFVSATVFANYATSPAMEPYWYTWVSQRDEGGGMLNGLLSHHIDLLRFTFGEIDDVGGRATTLITEKPMLGWEYRDSDPIGPDTPVAGTATADADDAAVIQGTLAGAPFSIAASWAVCHGTGVRVEAYGSNGTLVVDGDRVLGARSGDGGLDEIPLPDSCRPPDVAGHPMVAPFAALATDLAATMLGQPAADRRYATFRDGLRVQEVTEAVLGPVGSATIG